MSKYDLRKLGNHFHLKNAVEYLQIIKKLYNEDEGLFNFSGRLHKLRQYVTILDNTQNVRIYQFKINGEPF